MSHVSAGDQVSFNACERSILGTGTIVAQTALSPGVPENITLNLKKVQELSSIGLISRRMAQDELAALE